MIQKADPRMAPSRNVLGGALLSCSKKPLTGFFRDGCCNTNEEDSGLHVVCVQVTAEFLAFSKKSGNDLSTPVPAAGFPGLEPGDRWCLCVARWKEALDAGAAPLVVLEATHLAALQIVTLEELQEHALRPRG